MTIEEQIEAVVEQLRGQCIRDLPKVCGDLGVEETKELCEGVDQEVFCCESCGWWCDQSEMSDKDWTCDDCHDEPYDPDR